MLSSFMTAPYSILERGKPDFSAETCGRFKAEKSQVSGCVFKRSKHELTLLVIVLTTLCAGEVVFSSDRAGDPCFQCEQIQKVRNFGFTI